MSYFQRATRVCNNLNKHRQEINYKLFNPSDPILTCTPELRTPPKQWNTSAGKGRELSSFSSPALYCHNLWHVPTTHAMPELLADSEVSLESQSCVCVCVWVIVPVEIKCVCLLERLYKANLPLKTEKTQTFTISHVFALVRTGSVNSLKTSFQLRSPNSVGRPQRKDKYCQKSHSDNQVSSDLAVRGIWFSGWVINGGSVVKLGKFEALWSIMLYWVLSMLSVLTLA